MKLNVISSGVTEQSSEALRRLAVAEFMSKFALGPYAEFYTMIGNADSPRKASSVIDAGTNRAIGAEYPTEKSGTPQFGAAALKIYGDVVETDIAYERRGMDIGSQRALDLVNFSGSLGRFFMDACINGTLSATTISGFQEQATNLSRKEVFSSVNGGSLPTGNGNTERKAQAAFLEWLNAQIEDIIDGPDCIATCGSMLARLESIGMSYMSTSNVADIYGQNQVVKNYRNIPLVNAGFKGDATGSIITTTETEGTSEDCTSLYLLKFGERENVTFSTNKGLDVKDRGLVGTQYQTLCELDVDLIVLNPKAIKRLSGIRLSA